MTLELTLDEQGAVRSARVIDGDSNFSAAALAAVEGCRFRPASDLATGAQRAYPFER